jgi:peptidoglycan hydrolase-like protein with peptidoglycan-binding domain
VEAQTDSGLPRGDKIPNGVFKRTRYKYETIGFARPNFARAIDELAEAADPDAAAKDIMKPLVKSFTWRPGIKHPDVALVQLALSTLNDLKGVPRGEWDSRSQAAFANFQRRIGYTPVEATGIPDGKSLNELATRTGLFRI